MAKKNEETKVTRISAGDDSSAKKNPKPASSSSTSRQAKVPKVKSEKKGPLAAFFGYFVGAWKELREVRWPTRGATWSLTGAVLLFTTFFVVFILLLDAAFKFLFEQLL